MMPLNKVKPQLAQLLSRAERCVARRLATIIEAHGSTLEQWRVLTLLDDGTGHPMREIADYAFVPSPTLTRIVDRMIADNLVFRRIDPDDRRRVLLFCTDLGRELHSRLQADIDEYEKRLADGALDTDHLADQLTRIIESYER